MSFKYFFADYCEGKFLSNDEAKPATKTQLLHSMDCVLHMPDNFFGLVDECGTTLQFVVNADKSIGIDIPDASKKGSLVKTTDLKTCLSLVQSINEQIEVQQISGLVFSPWE